MGEKKVVVQSMVNRNAVEGILSHEKCGFRPGRSTVCTMLAFRRLQETRQNQRIPLYMCFIGLTKAYDPADGTLL